MGGFPQRFHSGLNDPPHTTTPVYQMQHQLRFVFAFDKHFQEEGLFIL